MSARAGARPGAAKSLRGRALAYLARREHSRAELTRKLAPHAESPDELARVLDRLVSEDLLSDRRFVESLVRRRASRFGLRRVAHELKGHELSDGLLSEAFDALSHSEFDRALDVWQQRFGHAPVDAREQGRQMRFLAARGFGGEVVARVIRRAKQR
ncbi:MAG: recombination regulator RecX [Burkholderiaceae bacterium]|nr:recombination regulator RecX [Burkholderiaceae bacterium]